jgi:hypothetical protein
LVFAPACIDAMHVASKTPHDPDAALTGDSGAGRVVTRFHSPDHQVTSMRGKPRFVYFQQNQFNAGYKRGIRTRYREELNLLL